MNRAFFTFDAELVDFLVKSLRTGSFPYEFKGNPSVKHIIEALRVPHTEVGLIYVNGVEADFTYQVRDNDRVQVYSNSRPVSSSLWDIEEPPRFLLDNHLGKLAAYLRMMGFDAIYRNDFQDSELAAIASREGRILLTRDRGLLMRKVIRWGYCLRSLDPRSQAREIVERYRLADKVTPFKRCLRCNGILEPVEKDVILDQLEPLTRLYYHEFHICTCCKQIYWKGSHYGRMGKFIEDITRGDR